MTELTETDKTALLELARSSIRANIFPNSHVKRPENISPAMTECRGCFVTLEINHTLRGCIGTIEAEKPLVDLVEENARHAAFSDPRFPPLNREEFSSIRIEISLLSTPEHLSFSSPEELVSKLIPGTHGVILSKGWKTATFLPQVWEQLPEPEGFLTELCRKGGMSPHCWKDPSTTVKIYDVAHFSESTSIN